MRHFIVLGFDSNSKKDTGKQLYLGGDRSEAIGAVNTEDKKYVRKELYELSVPEIRRHAAKQEEAQEAKEKKKSNQAKSKE